jgi:class 3 adenylate cyclase/tetratricopeptide (TPR) repeat protein
VTCATCGTQNDPGRKFCGNCGSRLAVACPACGAPNPSTVRFCGECGTGLPGTDATTPAVATSAATAAGAVAGVPLAEGTGPVSPLAERRLVSVLFADLVGFTTLSEARDAEEVRDLLSRYFETAQEIIGRYGGTVEKFIGDAVMAVWGTPTAHEDDAERAVRAALDLVDAVHLLGAGLGAADLQLRAGVLTGEAAVTIGATNQGMVAGDLVNTASRLQSVAPPGSVLVGEPTMRTAANAIVFEPAGEQLLKGKAAPVPAYRALRVVARRGGAGRSEQLEPPFVGRDAELRLLKDFYHGSARERGVRLVSVIGQGGIGKTRLAWEFQKYLDGISEPVLWHQGRSPSYGEGISFWALGEMVRMRAGIGEGDDEQTTRAKLAESVARYVLDVSERPELEGALLQLLGVGDGRTRERDTLFLAWRTFWERLSETGTVVLVFEDLQWADAGLLDFIEYLMAWSRGHPIYIVTLSRPELIDRRPTWGAGHRSFTSLGLGPLGDDDMRHLLTGLVPGMPETALREIVRRAEGVPLYAVETIRMLLNEGRIEQADGTFVVRGDLGEISVPESLHALIASRMDALDPEERAVVQDAAVLGQTFSVPALAAVHGGAEPDLEPLLRRLVQRELLTFDDDPRSPERGQFGFVQSLVREVAYGTLSRTDARARHLAAARYFEAQEEGELAGVLAEHYLAAYRARPGGEEGAAVAAQARIALRAAAVRAASVGSPGRAATYLEQAIEVAGNPADELQLRFEASDAAATAGKFDVARGHAERGIALADEAGDQLMRRQLVAQLAGILTEGHIEEARALLEEALAEPGLTPETPGYLDLATQLAAIYMRTDRSADAVALADLALPVAERAGDPDTTAHLLITRGTALANIGRASEATVTLMGAWEFSRRRKLGNPTQRAAINLGYVLEPDDTELSSQVSREGVEFARQRGNRWGIRYLLGNAIDGAIEIGDWDWVRGQLDEQLARDDLEPLERIWYGGGDAELRANRGGDVAEDVARILELAAPFNDPQMDFGAGNLRMSVALAAGDLAEVCAVAEAQLAVPMWGPESAASGARAAIWLGDLGRARRFRDAYDARPGRRTDAARRTIEAGIAMLEGRAPDARALYRESLGLWRDTGSLFSLALCQLDIVITGALDPAERRAAADEARGFFEKVGARPFLARLEAALAVTPSGPRAIAPGLRTEPSIVGRS